MKTEQLPVKTFLKSHLIIFIIFFLINLPGCTPKESAGIPGDEFLGRWNLLVRDVDREFPSWLELKKEGDSYTGRYVSGKEGSARPIPDIHITKDTLYYSLPPQYERQDTDLKFVVWKTDKGLEGYTFNPQGTKIMLTGVPAPELPYREVTEWGEPVNLIRDNNLENWSMRYADSTSGWKYQDGMLINVPPSVDLVSSEKFKDFKLNAEFRLSDNSNSGIYLRGRYELQIMNNPEKLTPTSVGGVYGFIQPPRKAAKQPGEWNKFDVTLIGRYITIVLNGDTTAYKHEIPGITGGALDGNEAEAGPIMLQGDHREIEYRNIVVIPAK